MSLHHSHFFPPSVTHSAHLLSPALSFLPVMIHTESYDFFLLYSLLLLCPTSISFNLSHIFTSPYEHVPGELFIRKLTGSPNPQSGGALTAGDLSIQVNLNDYLDIYCPHYPDQGAEGPGQPETLGLYLVAEASFQGCVETRGSIKRWECNDPHAAFGPARFTEKIQRFTPFSLGFEFLPGRHYYYSSLPADEGPPLPCMKLRVTVCCEPSFLIVFTCHHTCLLCSSVSAPPLIGPTCVLLPCA
ncbi:ephrin-A4 isoform X2 [Pseudoliparis swirei]|uniref:ephrin-A4 isoform X2 n=1 Tax=Pseudoliparis swirei TaxID=2059687 RepID=UPI0024BDEC2A|nr:ephrin-A4 isoform X2 [Pseudoliparis swirei]